MMNRLLSGLGLAVVGALAFNGPLSASAQEDGALRAAASTDAALHIPATAVAPVHTMAGPDVPLHATTMARVRQGDEGARRGAHADHRHGMHRHHHHRMAHAHDKHAGTQGLHGLRGLDLSETQRDRLFELRHAQAPELREQGKVVRNANRELRALSMSDAYDETKARELGERMAQARSRMALLHAQTGNEVWKTLTPEQREKLANRASRKGMGAHGTPRSAAS